MELKNFVREAILQISDGVLEASNLCAEKGVVVNPLMRGGEGLSLTQLNDTVSIVKFKVMLCKNSKSENQNGLGVFLGGIGLGTSEKENLCSDSMTSLDFSLPIEFPHGTK